MPDIAVKKPVELYTPTGHFCSKRFSREIDSRTLSHAEYHFIVEKLAEKMQEELDRLLSKNYVLGEPSQMIINTEIGAINSHLCNGVDDFPK